MKLVVTLPLRPNIANFLSRKAVRKTLVFVLYSCLLQLCSSCSKLNDAENIAVEIWYNGSPLECKTFESNHQLWTIQQLAFFISNVNLSNKSNVHQPQLRTTPWQTDDVVLIQPHLAECVAKSKHEVKVAYNGEVATESLQNNHYLQFLVPVDLDPSEQLSFTLAVPFALNHQNPLSQPSPLNLPSMFWSWRSGHKFFRLDMQGPNKSWVFHLGSVGCTAASTMRSPQNECVQPNRVRFDLNKKYDGTKLVMHLDRLIADTFMGESDSCLFHGRQESCMVLMSNLKTQDVFEWH